MVDGTRIREIGPDGILYVDDDGKQRFIDFVACYENHVKERTSPENWEKFKTMNKWHDEDYDRYVEWIKAEKAVGVRSVDGRPWRDNPFVEFYTEPPVLFDFQTEDEFHEVVFKARKLGWQIFDLT
jgi:hypothetical protein